MMSLIFCLLFIAMLCAYLHHTRTSYAVFAVTMVLGLYWFRHHATDTLSILL
ncbi:DUF5993 family protein [Photobacterium japonica]|uniref:DUF5993 family protein n=1 Tax=Photobacterium japonica TaxID=2910235 RepID=UPI003D0C6CA7